MVLCMARPFKHPKTGIYWFRKRVPDKLREVVGKIEEKISLRTRDPLIAKAEHAKVAATIEARWLRLAAGPQSLSHLQAEAIAGEIYRTMTQEHRDNPDQVPGRFGGLLMDQAFLKPGTVKVFPMGTNPEATKRLADVLTPFGSDKAALDAARVFRVAGSLNSRADPLDAEVRPIWCNGSAGEPFRHVFSDLADEVLPHTRAELASLSAERAKRKAGGRDTGRPAQTLTVATWAETMLSDLQRLRAHRYPEGAIRPGERDRWLFCAATAMAWLCPHQVLERELSALAHEAAGWQGKETRSRMSSALARARMAAAGQRLEWDGREVDPRYRMQASTVIEWLEIEPGEMREAGLRMLVDTERAREVAAERQRDSRRRKGAQDRTAVQAARLELGRKARFLQAREGLTVRDLADKLGMSAFQISKAIAEANAKDG